MDRFYEGKVKSYDAKKNKHVILYNDDEIEVLCLDKERWELIPDDGKLIKKSKPSGSPYKGVSADKKANISGSKKSEERGTPKGKRTPKKDSNRKAKDVKGKSTSSQETRLRSDLSDSEPALASEVDALDSGELKAVKADDEVESPPPKEEKSESTEKETEGDGAKENDDGSKEVDEEAKPVTEGDQDAGMEDTPKESESSDLRKSDLDEKQLENLDESSQEEMTDAQQADEADKDAQQADEADKGAAEENKPQSSVDEDDEPIGNWKRRIGKSSKGK